MQSGAVGLGNLCYTALSNIATFNLSICKRFPSLNPMVNFFHNQALLKLMLVVLCTLLLGLLSCQQVPVTPTLVSPTPTGSVTAQQTSTAVALATEVALDVRPLTVWAQASLLPPADSEAMQILSAALETFAAQESDLIVEFVPKSDRGQASLLNYLRSAQRVAPAVLPDLILLDAQQLWQVAELGLIQPVTLTELVTAEGYYPFTLDAVTINENLYGFPYFADVLQLVYNPEVVSSPPATWAELLASNERFVFQGGGQNGLVDDWVVLHYLAVGGETTLEGSVNTTALATLFTDLAQGQSAGVLPPDLITFASSNAIWSALSAETATLASLPASQYLSQLTPESPYRAGSLPRPNDSPRTIARVYAFAILTNDEGRRSQALALLDHLFDPELHSELTLTMHWLPTRPVVLENWPNTLTFKGVVRSQLEGAVAFPSDRSFTDFARQLQQMLTRVLNGEITPERAATEFR